MVALSSIQNKIINPEEEIFAGPYFQLPNSPRRFRDWKPEGHGMVDLNRAIVQSCDVYFYKLADRLGIEKLSNFFEHFSFGKKTGIDMPYESKGVLPSNEWKQKNIGYKWTDGDTVITGIGQGFFSATPTSISICNKYFSKQRYYIYSKTKQKISTKKSKDILNREEFFKKNITNMDWDIITNAMFDVVNKENGTAYWSIRDKKNNIAGKTGTVQVYSLSQETDERDEENIPEHLKDHSLYIAFAPKEDPKIVIATVIENVGSGSKFAAPISNKIINFYLDNKLEKY